ncbi:MurR/RpiR family transcriptional regulator HpxU [Conyzicola nivalis]|uniref:RpiR family transcriptional regulator n=1 Tax=Conyzicola nivalis TaxID=1477021 RepID=A0A916SKT1_9MICO|nr:MurR/RpiR family transcriptional regulator [Conyzicola nivalis]GGB02383.1 RpiR family transcriptional regulator [Conyzicola nivalis]
MADLAARIEAGYGYLSPQEQRAADFLREHIADLAVYNSTEVARLSGVSKATVSRLYRRLGFENAEALREHVRGLRASGTPLASDATTSHSEHLDRELANLRSALAGLDLAPAASLIAGARRVLVVGFRNSYPMALHLRQQLAQAREGVQLAPLPGQSIGEELAALGADDVVVLVGFRRRPRGFARVLALVESSEARSVLLTDAPRLGADVVIECPVDSVTAFDSYAAAASVISLLAAAVLAADLAAGRSRIAAIGDAYRELDELE